MRNIAEELADRDIWKKNCTKILDLLKKVAESNSYAELDRP
jgi:hypothetical protein